MKVLHVIDALGVGGGAEHSLAALLPRLRDLGVESTVSVLIPRVGGLQARLVDEGFDVRVLEGPGRAGQLRSLRGRIREQQPDLVHASLVNASLLARLATVGTDVPLVNSLVNTTYDPVRVRTLGIPAWKLRIVRGVDGWTARRRVDHVHAITGAVEAEAVDLLGLDPDHITVIPRGRDGVELGVRSAERRHRTRATLGIADDTPVVLNVGRQDDQKGQEPLVRALAQLTDRHPDVVLLVAGRPGSASPAIDRAIAETGIGDRVRLLGHREDVADLLAAADVFAFPSLYEGLGCSLLEAMALEAPIVGSDAPAIAEVLEDGALGEVALRDDVGSLVAALDRLLSDPERRAELAEAGRARFLERYDLDRVAEATKDLYDRVLAEHPRS